MSIHEQRKLDMTKNLAVLLMDDNPDLTMEQALSAVMNSDTYQRLQNESTRLFYQSPRYVYSFFQDEQKKRQDDVTSSIGDICILHVICRKTLMKAELLKGKAMDRTFVNFITDSVMLEVADWYEHHSLQIGVAKQDKCR